MRLVHNDCPDIPKPMTGKEQGMSNALRRHVQKLGAPKPDVVQHAVSVSAHPGFRLNAPRPELVALVLHQRHKRGDHNAQSTTRQGGKLETHAFSSPCRPQGEHVFSKGQVVHRLHLMRPERVESPMRLQQACKGLRCVQRILCGVHVAGVVGFPIFGPQIDKTKVMRNIVAGNWKSNKLMGEAQEWMDGMAEWLASHEGVEVMVGAPAPYLAALAGTAPEGLHILAQNVSAEGHGAHTGEFTADMLKSCGVAGAIVGHSERRARFGDTDDKVKAKVQALVDEGLQAVFCCGETLEEREAGRQEDVVHAQLKAAVLDLPSEALDRVVVAYEPVWAIGTGKTATSAQAQDMHAAIRGWLTECFGAEKAAGVAILYGGSCKPSNAAELFGQADINGGLIGGAALNPTDFQGVLGGHPGLKG